MKKNKARLKGTVSPDIGFYLLGSKNQFSTFSTVDLWINFFVSKTLTNYVCWCSHVNSYRFRGVRKLLVQSLEFPKVASTHMKELIKATNFTIFQRLIQEVSKAFNSLQKWILAAFRKFFVAALAASRKISRISKTFLYLFPNIVSISCNISGITQQKINNRRRSYIRYKLI